MRVYLFFLLSFVMTACSQKGLNAPSTNTNPIGGTSSDGSTSSGASSTGSGQFRSLVGRFGYPKIPDENGREVFFFTSFANTGLRQQQESLQGANPPQQLRLDGFPGTDVFDGSKYCFSNESMPGSNAVKCKRAATTVVDEIKSLQSTPTGRQPIFINALQFFLHNNDAASKVTFKGAYVEKAPIFFDRRTGALLQPDEGDIQKISYGSGCNLSVNSNAVGFESPSYLEKTHYLTGLWIYERPRRKVFESIDTDYEPHICQTGTSQFLCNLFATKVSVWYAALFPVLYSDFTIGKRQFPSQVYDQDNNLTGSPGTATTSFGLYADGVSLGTSALQTPVFGKVDGSGNLIPHWDQTFITKLCIRGDRTEKDAAGNTVIRPMIQAARFEIRAPFIQKKN